VCVCVCVCEGGQHDSKAAVLSCRKCRKRLTLLTSFILYDSLPPFFFPLVISSTKNFIIEIIEND